MVGSVGRSRRRQEVVVGEQSVGPEGAGGEEVGDGVSAVGVGDGEANPWKGRGRILAFEVQRGGAIGSPPTPVFEGREGDAKGNEGGGATAAKGVEGEGRMGGQFE